MSKDIPGSKTDLGTMSTDQQTMLGVQTFNVQQQYNQAEGQVTIPQNNNAVDTSVNDGFMKDAPNLPFCLPFLPCNKD
jgi:hypothetical protein